MKWETLNKSIREKGHICFTGEIKNRKVYNQLHNHFSDVLCFYILDSFAYRQFNRPFIMNLQQ